MRMLTVGLICLILSACGQPGTDEPTPPPNADLSIVTTGLEGKGDRAFGGSVILGVDSDAYKFAALGVESSALTSPSSFLQLVFETSLKMPPMI